MRDSSDHYPTREELRDAILQSDCLADVAIELVDDTAGDITLPLFSQSTTEATGHVLEVREWQPSDYSLEGQEDEEQV